MIPTFPALLLASALVSSEPAPETSWIPVGPPGGNVRALAKDPSTTDRVYLGGENGMLYRSDDGGRTWYRPRPGFTRRRCVLDEIVVDRDGVVYVGFWDVEGKGGGLARSVDGGKTFVIPAALDGESVRAIAVAPSDQRRVAAGTLGGVFVSGDRGETWSRVTPKADSDLRNLESLAFDPEDTNVLYAGTWHLAWRTSDAGRTWAPIHHGMLEDSHVMTLTVDTDRSRTLYATACTGIYRSKDEGRDWVKLEGIPESSRRTRAFSLDPADPDLLVGGTTEGLWISRDRGARWRLVTSRSLVVNATLVLSDGTLLVGTEDAGVLRSSDRGATWEESNQGFSERFVRDLLFDRSRDRVLASVWGTRLEGGVFVSDDAQGRWHRWGEGLTGRQVLSLALLGPTALAGTDDGIFTRGPEANGWTRMAIQVAGSELHARVTELLASREHRIVAATSAGLILSADAGRTWIRAPLGEGEALALAASPREPNRMVAATRSGFFRSEDGGDTWAQVSRRPEGAVPHSLAFLSSDDRVLLGTTTAGLFRSEDGGVTWRRALDGIPKSDLTGIAVHPEGRTVYVSDFARGGIYRSTDAGLTWRRVPCPGMASDRVWSLGLDPTFPDRVFASSSAGGLYLKAPRSARGTGGLRASRP